MSESNTSERRLAAIDKQMRALELRKAGVSFPKIAEALGYGGPSGAYGAVQSALRRVLREPVAELISIELARMDEITMTLWPRVRQGDEKAIGRIMDVMARRAKMLGLDAPAKHELSGDALLPAGILVIQMPDDAQLEEGSSAIIDATPTD